MSVRAETCQASPTYTVTATVTNTLAVDLAPSLPEYVKAHKAGTVEGGDRQWVQLFGPVGAELASVRIDGVEVQRETSLSREVNTNPEATGAERRPSVQGVMDGRAVGVVSLADPHPQHGDGRGHRPCGRQYDHEVSHTLKVRPVPVNVETTCPR